MSETMKLRVFIWSIVSVLTLLFFTYAPFDGTLCRFNVEISSIGTYDVSSSVSVDYNRMWEKASIGISTEDLASVKKLHKEGMAKTIKEIHKMQRQTGSIFDYIFSLSIKDLFVE